MRKLQKWKPNFTSTFAQTFKNEEEEAGWVPPAPPKPKPVPLPKYTPDEIIKKFSKP